MQFADGTAAAATFPVRVASALTRAGGIGGQRRPNPAGRPAEAPARTWIGEAGYFRKEPGLDCRRHAGRTAVDHRAACESQSAWWRHPGLAAASARRATTPLASACPILRLPGLSLQAGSGTARCFARPFAYFDDSRQRLGTSRPDSEAQRRLVGRHHCAVVDTGNAGKRVYASADAPKSVDCKDGGFQCQHIGQRCYSTTPATARCPLTPLALPFGPFSSPPAWHRRTEWYCWRSSKACDCSVAKTKCISSSKQAHLSWESQRLPGHPPAWQRWHVRGSASVTALPGR